MTEQKNGKLEVMKKSPKKEEVLENDNVHFFKKPFKFEGKEHKSISLDLDGLTGDAIERAELSFTTDSPQQSAQTPLKELSKPFLAYLVAESSGVPIEFVRELPAAEYAKVTTRVQTFLLSGE